MSLINQSIATIMPYLPKWFAKPFAKPYVAGETVNEALSNIKELNARGTTICLTTHYLEEAEKLCDKITIINNGKILRLGKI